MAGSEIADRNGWGTTVVAGSATGSPNAGVTTRSVLMPTPLSARRLGELRSRGDLFAHDQREQR
jgi:hypothetical protein